jgi:hypothetical protein
MPNSKFRDISVIFFLSFFLLKSIQLKFGADK